MLRNRYRRLPAVVALTLPRLKQDPAFRVVVAELRRRGWARISVRGQLIEQRDIDRTAHTAQMGIDLDEPALVVPSH